MMPSDFTAIPVGQGDSFFLRSGGTSLLVDGGRARKGFEPLFRKTLPGVNHVGVVICTHNDADHAAGVLGLLEGTLHCDELWLPGRWLTIIKKALAAGVQIADALIEDIQAEEGTEATEGFPVNSIDEEPQANGFIPREPDEIERLSEPWLERFATDWIGDKEELREESVIGAEVTFELDPLSGWPVSAFSDLSAAAATPLNWRSGMLPSYPSAVHLSGSQQLLLVSAASAVLRIRDILVAAFKKRIPVRWFEHKDHPAATRVGPLGLEPLNSELLQQRASFKMIRFLRAISLTVINRESLAFYWPGPGPGVVFTADTDLRGARIPTKLDGALCTAPHHGSENNADAYRSLRSPNLVWVRSDGLYPNRPGQSFLSQSTRFCTRCRSTNNKMPEQTVRFGLAHQWVARRARRCHCEPHPPMPSISGP